MNIFVLDENPWNAAQMVCNRHSVKMPLETAQLLCTALAAHGVLDTPLRKFVAYKPTHRNHPCTIWASESRENFNWLVNHGIALCWEYNRRYGREHKCLKVIEDCARLELMIPEGKMTPHPLCMKDEYKIGDDVVESYRNYYIEGKTYMNKGAGPNWPTNSTPKWWPTL